MKNLPHQSSGTPRRPIPSRPVRRRRRPGVELLEDRLTPANLDISAAGVAQLVANPTELNDITLKLNQGTGRYEFTDAGAPISVSGAGAAGANAQGAGTNTVTALAAFLTSITIDTGDLSDFVKIQSTAVPTTVTTTGIGADNDTVTLGDAGSVQGITATVNVTNLNALTTLVVDDSADPTGRTATLSDTSITGLAPGVITYDPAAIGDLTVNGGLGVDTFTVANTIAGSTTTLNTGGGSDFVLVQAGSAGSTLNVNGQAGDDVFRVVPSANATFNFDGGPQGAAGDTLDYAGSGTVTLNGTGAGTITQAGVNDVTFTDIENVLQGPGTLQFNSPAFLVTENGIVAVITITRIGGTSGQVSVDFATDGGSAVAGQDFTATSQTVTFGDSETTKTVSVPILDNQLVQSSRSVTLKLSNPTGGATLRAPSTATLTILDNDQPAEVTGQVKIVFGKVQGTRRARVKVTVTNKSNRTFVGPIAVELVGLNPKIKLLNQAGVTNTGHPFQVIPADVAPNGNLVLIFQFSNPKLKKIKFSLRLFATGGLR
jgi:hypothetical protein